MSNLLVMPGPNGHQSASARRIAALEEQAEYYKAVVAALIAREGGVVTIPRIALDIKGDMKITTGATAVRIELIASLTEPPATPPDETTPS
jgi:hypothetical protein